MASEEMIDEITPEGRWTGVTLPKSQIHAEGRWHACVQAGITDGCGNLLLMLRGPEVKLLRNVWDPFFAGHISAYKGLPEQRNLFVQAQETVVREGAEEIDLTLPPGIVVTSDFLMIGTTRVDQLTPDGWWDRALCLNYLIVLPDLNMFGRRLEAGKVRDLLWMPASGVEERFLYPQSDFPVAVRQPDQYLLVTAMVDAARRVAQCHS